MLTDHCYQAEIQSMKINITAIPAYQDNYIWIIHNDKYAVVVDPGLAAPVMEYLNQHDLILTQILITHHHWDHVNGLNELQAAWGCVVYAPIDSRIPGKLTHVKEGHLVEIAELKLSFKVIETPGHTLTHICYFNEEYLFCGDTLFSMGCGRMFEGNATQYVDSLNKIKSLPPEIKVYCTHEYTLNNIDFALSIEPDNDALRQKKQHVELMRHKGLPSLPVLLSDELTLNPFLKTNQSFMQTIFKKTFNMETVDEVTCFAMLRKSKDNF
jgi:hydroxyacylglutathione hydrolase